MDESTAEPSGTSPDASPSPSDMGASPAPSEAIQSQPEAVQSGEQQTATPETAPVFPEEIDSLAGEDRRTNWQQLRTRYDDVNRQLGELKPQVEAFTPIQQKMEAWGGIEQVEQAYSLAQSLFAPITDPNTGQPVLDQNGLPSYSAEPFVERMANESPQTLYEISHRAMNQPLGNETVSHEIFRSYYGLDPELMPIYRQIQSPKDAAQFMQNTGQVTPEQLVGIPQQYHEAAKSLTPAMWSEVELMAETTRDQYLAERAEMLEMRSFREEQKSAIQQQQQAEQQAIQARVEQAGTQAITSARDRVLNATMDKLKTEVKFFPDEADNQTLQQIIMDRAAAAVQADKNLAPESRRCNDLFRLAAHLEANKEIYPAKRALVEAEALAAKLGREFNKQVAQQVKWFNDKMGMARQGQQNAQASAQTRPEFVRTGNPSAPNDQNRRIEPAANNQRFGLSPAEITEQASRLAMERQRANGITG